MFEIEAGAVVAVPKSTGSVFSCTFDMANSCEDVGVYVGVGVENGACG